MGDRVLFGFEGLSRPVALVACPELAEQFAAVFRGWHIAEVEGATAEPPVITLSGGADGYGLDAPWLATAIRHRDPVSAICAFIAKLIQAQLRADPRLLCLHGAAAEFAGKLVVFPSRYRAGKSMLCAGLAAGGVRIFADDVLLIRPPEDRGVAPGILPRLRLPLPEDLSAPIRTFVDRHRGLVGDRYLYLRLSREELAERGTQAPIGACVLLDRSPEAKPALTPIPHGEMLRHVIWQNFAREGGSAEIMHRLHRVVEGARCFRLHYAEAEQAVGLLKETFTVWHETPDRRVAPPGTGSKPDEAREAMSTPGHRAPSTGCYARNPSVSEVMLDSEFFLARSEGTIIYHLNSIGSGLWRLLAEPMTIRQMAEVLRAAFPDVSPPQVEADVRALVAYLAQRRLLLAGPEIGAASQVLPSDGPDQEVTLGLAGARRIGSKVV